MDEQLAVYRFSKRVAERYANISQALEVWNEMDYFTYVPADMYASFYKAAALGVVDSGTSLPKIIGGLCEPVNSNPYLTILYKSDVFDYSDAFNWHYHIYDRAERSVTEFVDGTKAGQFATFANTYLSSLPSWCTEAGIKLYTPAGCADMTFAQQKIQANYMVTSACQSLAAGTDKLLVHSRQYARRWWLVRLLRRGRQTVCFRCYRSGHDPDSRQGYLQR